METSVATLEKEYRLTDLVQNKSLNKETAEQQQTAATTKPRGEDLLHYIILNVQFSTENSNAEKQGRVANNEMMQSIETFLKKTQKLYLRDKYFKLSTLNMFKN